MPRDKKGVPFGIDTIVDTPDGPLKICGFAVANHPVSRETIRAVAAAVCASCDQAHQTRVYYWHEVEATDDNPWKDVDDHTDMCHMDEAQRKGLMLPSSREGILAIGLEADKWVWGA